MSARDAILAKMRRAAGVQPVPLPDVAGWVQPAALNAADRIAQFRAGMAAAHGEVHDTDAAAWPHLLRQIAAAKQVTSLLVGDGTAEAVRLAEEPAAGLRLVPYDRPASQWRPEMFNDLDAGLTRARSAIAQTGSLILWPGASEPRLMSLVPPIHFVLLEAASIHMTLTQAMQAENWAAGMPTNAVVISGPSKTADIQQTLAYGAHGPKQVIVLLCHGAGGVS